MLKKHRKLQKTIYKAYYHQSFFKKKIVLKSLKTFKHNSKMLKLKLNLFKTRKSNTLTNKIINTCIERGKTRSVIKQFSCGRHFINMHSRFNMIPSYKTKN